MSENGGGEPKPSISTVAGVVIFMIFLLGFVSLVPKDEWRDIVSPAQSSFAQQ